MNAEHVQPSRTRSQTEPPSPDEQELFLLLRDAGAARTSPRDRHADGDWGRTSDLLRAYEELRAAGGNESAADGAPAPELRAARLLTDRIAALDARRQAEYAARLLEPENGPTATGGH